MYEICTLWVETGANQLRLWQRHSNDGPIYQAPFQDASDESTQQIEGPSQNSAETKEAWQHLVTP